MNVSHGNFTWNLTSWKINQGMSKCACQRPINLETGFDGPILIFSIDFELYLLKTCFKVFKTGFIASSSRALDLESNFNGCWVFFYVGPSPSAAPYYRSLPAFCILQLWLNVKKLELVLYWTASIQSEFNLFIWWMRMSSATLWWEKKSKFLSGRDMSEHQHLILKASYDALWFSICEHNWFSSWR